jgi:hypothetical protein
VRKPRKQEKYMLVQDTIGCVAQVERRESAIDGALIGQEPIGFLVLETDEESAESRVLTSTGRWKFGTFLEAVDKLHREGLLHILHSSWLNGYDSRGLECLRDWSDLYRNFSPRLEKLDTVQLVVITPAGESVVSVRKHTLEPQGPLPKVELTVTGKPIRSSTGTVAWNESEFVGDWSDVIPIIKRRVLHTSLVDIVDWPAHMEVAGLLMGALKDTSFRETKDSIQWTLDVIPLVLMCTSSPREI